MSMEILKAKEPELPVIALRVDQAAKSLGVSDKTIYRMIKAGLPHLRFGGCLLIPVDGARAWIAEQSKSEVATDE
ncbi:helix-turn-helix domain-containing protein [Tuwongella immobilis]|uniref:Excisionase family dna binding domain-containing protein:: HTH_17 n=1 Tax=Tuwongella immobilis TaxID=692036 RepID=A0A6C2YRE9_9BACT|nr:helix-turn-helix domain-containing protein [Tuwongella immobilis]VIP03937.1 excisionase family dna binding domain-containing protein : : HTH_17 [Tuwongella immobilis]VTS05241.1 excisionase family dna binding domain-containing protein : : HTH_17 [Tuwongella immobilis]